MIERKGMCRDYRGKHSERNRYVRVYNITFVTRYGVAVGESVQTFCWSESQIVSL